MLNFREKYIKQYLDKISKKYFLLTAEEIIFIKEILENISDLTPNQYNALKELSESLKKIKRI